MFSFKKFLYYCWGAIIRPVPTLKQIAWEPSLAYPFAAYFLFGLLYGLFALVGYFSGHAAAGILVNFISAKDYYLWEGLLMIPITMQIYLLFAALAHLFARLLGGKGSFEATLSVLGFTYSIPLIVLFWVPDVLLFSCFGSSVQLTLVPLYGTAAGLWTFLVSTIGIKIAQQLSFPRALLVTILSVGISYAFLGGLLIR
jgi:hypothetical protein